MSELAETRAECLWTSFEQCLYEVKAFTPSTDGFEQQFNRLAALESEFSALQQGLTGMV